MSSASSLSCIVWVAAVAASACGAAGANSTRAREDSRTYRDDALARAQVFLTAPAPEVLAPTASAETDVACRFLMTEPTGTTPKFDCELPDGTTIKVKYGNTPEIAGEIAATRVLAALGFGADRVTLARRVRCYGCPPSPFYARRIAGWAHLEGLLRRTRDYNAYHDFEWAAVEQKMDGDGIEADGQKGWGFFELKQIDHTRGGAAVADIDALRLMAVLLAHWDNKPANQRLVCLADDSRNGRCPRALVMLQDLGATFGPRKVDLEAWRTTSIWADAEGCRVSMKALPHGGGTFEDVQVSEPGRRLLADRLATLSPAHLETLFRDARFPGQVHQWVTAFQQKVQEIAARAPCPSR